MNKAVSILVIFMAFMAGCGNKEEGSKDDSGFFPALSYIQSQVAHIDTSLYSIIQVTKKDSVSDTVFIRREDFKKAAEDFLSIPDITAKKWKKKYEETKMYDDALERVIITYTPKDKEVEIQREDIIITPSQQGNDQVETIFIDQLLNNDDSTVEKKMTWNVNGRFQVISITQKKGSPEQVKTREVSWSNFRSAE